MSETERLIKELKSKKVSDKDGARVLGNLVLLNLLFLDRFDLYL